MEQKEILKASADIINSEGKSIGTAEFVEVENGTQRFVKVKINVSDKSLIPGIHAVHIHEKPLCEPPDFKSAAGHFDPGPYGNTDPDENHPYHMGDLPNIDIKEDGTGSLEAFSTRITLSDGPLSILADEGTSIMVHEHGDPYHSGLHGSGTSGGSRHACGVIKRI